MDNPLDRLLNYIEGLLEEEYYWLEYSDYYGLKKEAAMSDHCGRQLNKVREKLLEIIKEDGQSTIL